MQPTSDRPGQALDVGWEPELRNRLHAVAAEAGWLCTELHDVDVFHFAKPTIPLQGPIVVRWAGGAPVRVVMDGMDIYPTTPTDFISQMAYAMDMGLAVEGGVQIIEQPVRLAVRSPHDGAEQVGHLYPPAFEAHHTLEDVLGWAEGLPPGGEGGD